MYDPCRKVIAMNRISEANPSGQFWPVVFVRGCNLRCPYCLNTKIVEPPDDEFIPMDEVLSKLDDWDEPGVMISGGEFLMGHLDSENQNLINALSAGGRKIGISTNGMSPEKILNALRHPSIGFVALDCKFGIDNTEEDAKQKAGMIGLSSSEDTVNDIHCSLGCLARWHDSDGNAQSEVRITMYPPLVGKEDVLSVAKLVHPRSKLVLQQYRKNKMFDGSANAVEPYPEAFVAEIRDVAEKISPAPVELRWP